ncbi:MAG: hypothetical protein JWO85_1211 [Candidatus Eremiobacteraeota bacterium]|nr:hypothetical protein [Candidatus Eremiobacteraeota bacterium]
MDNPKPALVRATRAALLLGMTGKELGHAVTNQLLRSVRVSQRLTLVHVEDLERILQRELRPDELLEHEKRKAP